MSKPLIFLSGGGTMGSVMPLVALWERLGDEFEYIWLGTRKGIERAYIGGLKMEYAAIPAGKIRRYFSIKTLLEPFFILAGILWALFNIAVLRPKIVVVSGSFVSVPVAWAAWASGTPLLVHQEDLKIGLAGKLTIPLSTIATFSFAETMATANAKNKILIGNPVRKMFEPAAAGKWKKSGLPMILIMGGGLGAQKLNEVVSKILPEFSGKAEIVHLTGKNKITGLTMSDSYRPVEGMWGEEMAQAMAAADIVVSRAGLSAMSELAALGKAVIFVPLAGVGQNENAEYFAKRGAALLSSDEPADLIEKIYGLLKSAEKRAELSENIGKIFPPDSAGRLAEVVKKMI
jgi:UDP-N-acetylglucosamine--N-acetylmuramyl-(pentapeptide) pyrophosphoryl-undecaprenol N-acetylglucosamine transferase